MESYCEIWEGLIGIGSWHKKFAVLKNSIITFQNIEKGNIDYKIHLGICTIKKLKSNHKIELFNGVGEMTIRFKQSRLKKKWEETIQ